MVTDRDTQTDRQITVTLLRMRRGLIMTPAFLAQVGWCLLIIHSEFNTTHVNVRN